MNAKGMPSPTLAQAVSHHRAGRLDQAAQLYRQALLADPSDAVVLQSLGTLYLQQGDVEQALPLLERATIVNPLDAESWMAHGGALVRAGAFGDAENAFARAISLQPELAGAHVNLGNARRRLGRPLEAIASYQRAIALEPASAMAHFNLGSALADAGDPAAATDAFRKAIEIAPAHLPAMTNLAGILLGQGHLEEALAWYRRVAGADGTFLRAHYNVGVALQSMGRNSESADAFAQAVRANDADLDAWNNLCISLLRCGRPVEALAASRQYLERLPPFLCKPLAYEAAALVELGRREDAAALLDFDNLLARREQAPPPGFGSSDSFNKALADHILQHETLEYEPSSKSTRGGRQTGELLVPGIPPIDALSGLIEANVTDYISSARARMPSHPYVQRLPAKWRVTGWAVVLETQGHQGPHFHPDGCISGVYYVRLPPSMRSAADTSGCIEFGRVADSIGGSAEPLLATIRPEEGTMLLFPSYFYHRTLSFEDDSPRISIAFDVLPG